MSDVVFGGSATRDRKHKYRLKLIELLNTYTSILIVGVDNVGSHQMQKTRIALRGEAVILMGKNTVMRKVIREEAEKNPKLEALLPHVVGNMGLVFTNNDLGAVRKIIMENKVPASAKAGAIAPVKVVIPAGPTGLDPGQTSFFQAVSIATKIARGSIEIATDVTLLLKGAKCTASHVALLGKLNMKPFFYGFKVLTAYEDGFVYDAAVLALTPEDLKAKFSQGVAKLAAIGLEVGYPCVATVAHSVTNAFKKLLALSMESGFEFKQATEWANASSAGAAAKGGDASGSDSDSSSSSSSSSSGGGMAMFS